jgi:hypothetical protein
MSHYLPVTKHGCKEAGSSGAGNHPTQDKKDGAKHAVRDIGFSEDVQIAWDMQSKLTKNSSSNVAPAGSYLAFLSAEACLFWVLEICAGILGNTPP